MHRRSVALTLLMLTGCGTPASSMGTTDGGAADGSAARVPPGCNVAFTLDVRSGPSAPLQIAGDLTYVLDAGGHLVGVLVPAGAGNDASRYLRVSGTVSNGTIVLQITQRDGSTITGTGPLAGAAATCAMSTTMVGTLTGPRAGDVGDWAGRNNGVSQVRDGLVPYVCFAACSYLGGSDSQCNSQCTVNGLSPCGIFYSC